MKLPNVRIYILIVYSLSYNFLSKTIPRKRLKVLLNFMFEKSWTDAILSSLLWFFYHHLNGSSEYIRPQRSIPRFLHFAQKTRNNLFHCSLSSQELFLRPLMNPSRNSLLVSESCIQRKEIGDWYFKGGGAWQKK